MTLRLGGDGAITGCTSLENPDLTVSGLTISGSFDAEKVLVASGTAAAPSYTFSGDTDNGLYYAGTNSIGLATAGTNAILIDSSARVGIGTTSPDSLLDLEFANSRMRFEQESGSNRPVIRGTRTSDKANRAISIGGSDISFLIGSTSTAALTSADEKVRIDSAGNIGIGTSSPTHRLTLGTVTPASTATPETISLGGTFSNTAGANPKLRIWTDGSTIMGIGVSSNQIDYITTSTYSHVFYSNSTERMRIDSSGRIGIGITSPVQILDIGSSGYAGIGFKSSRTTAADNIGGPVWRNSLNQEKAFIQSTVDGQLKFGAGGATERLRIDSSGNLGIGTTVPRGRLHVGPDLASGATDAARINLKQASTTAADGIYLERSGERRGYSIFIGPPNDGLTFRANNFGTFTTTMYLDRVGNVGIGTTSPTRKLDISGSGGTSIRIIDTSSYAELSLNGAGTANFIESDDALAYNVGGSERMRILSTGGLTFNGDTAQANALDDYEEGTCTLGLTGSGSPGSLAYIHNSARYVKIGSFVFVSGYVNVSNKGSHTGGIIITGLPFTVANNSTGYSFSFGLLFRF